MLPLQLLGSLRRSLALALPGCYGDPQPPNSIQVTSWGIRMIRTTMHAAASRTASPAKPRLLGGSGYSRLGDQSL
ncbi:hypothetical protein PCANC_02218 [Puccinia coronata f. sp. avenae]|uniref:Secreted protein n=1 Tax=Puccinia coronata f. sp. avenae TaxID=200324 RepID=A0A2N5W0Z3_9BASI|nr:hypothetical protein PCANC_02218 [Puccinia coronata f. sp. avenae]